METGNDNVLFFVREAESILGKDIDDFFAYLYSGAFQSRALQIQMNGMNKKRYQLHLSDESQFLRASHQIIDNWYYAANTWGLLMEWIMKRNVCIKDCALFALKATKLVSKPFHQYVPFVLLTTFWHHAPDLYAFKDVLFEDFEKIAESKSFDNDFVNRTIRKLLPDNDADVEKALQEKKLLNLLNYEKQLVRHYSPKRLLNDFEVKKPWLIKSIQLRMKINVYNRLIKYSFSENDFYKAISVGVILQNVMSKEDILKEFDSLDEVYQTLLKLFTTTYRLFIPDILHEFWEYSDQLNC